VTYHGPGQVVGYALFDLNAMQTPTRCYVEYLQALLGEYARDLGLDVHAPHPEGHVGVFPTEMTKVSHKPGYSAEREYEADSPLRSPLSVSTCGTA
jgi:lipoate-protein ligase B